MFVVSLVPEKEWVIKVYVNNFSTFVNLDIFQYGGGSTGSEYFLNNEARVSYTLPCNFCTLHHSNYTCNLFYNVPYQTPFFLLFDQPFVVLVSILLDICSLTVQTVGSRVC